MRTHAVLNDKELVSTCRVLLKKHVLPRFTKGIGAGCADGGMVSLPGAAAALCRAGSAAGLSCAAPALLCLQLFARELTCFFLGAPPRCPLPLLIVDRSLWQHYHSTMQLHEQSPFPSAPTSASLISHVSMLITNATWGLYVKVLIV